MGAHDRLELFLGELTATLVRANIDFSVRVEGNGLIVTARRGDRYFGQMVDQLLVHTSAGIHPGRRVAQDMIDGLEK